MTPPQIGRLAHALTDLQVLFPGCSAVVGQPPDATRHEFAVLPHASRPRLLTPTTWPRSAAASVRRYSDADSWRQRSGKALLAAALHARAGRLVARHHVTVCGQPSGPDICEFLANLLGRPVVIALAVGAARANAKPVLQVMSTRGETLCFAKVAVTDLSKTLVAREADVLVRLGAAGLRTLEIPRVLDRQSWNGTDVLLLSALPTSWRTSRGRSNPAMQQVREVAEVGGLTVHPLADGDELRRCLLTAVAASGPLAARLRRAIEALIAEHGAEPLAHGSWHGDWGPWNMSRSGRTVSVWDWERFTPDVPLGLDALHFLFQGRAVGPDHRKSARELAEDARRVSCALGSPNQSPEALAATYAALIATRYLEDLSAPGDALEWHVDRLVSVLESLGAGRPDALAVRPASEQAQ